MKTTFNIAHDQITLNKQLWFHFYPGLLITIFYILVSPLLIENGLPGLAVLLIAEVAVLAPTGLTHMLIKGKILNGSFSLKHVIAYTEKLTWKQYLKWSLIGFGLCLLVYLPFYPVGIYLREQVFNWLPEWYFNPSYGTENIDLVAKVFLVGILIDGLIGPIVEELFFRGYLLPRMAFLKKWAPVVNGTLFGLYHFWQPHNYLGIIGVGIVLSFVVWKTRNVYVGIIIHCTMNIIGAIGGYMAASGGVLIDR
jgi:membrane protease YdiL (CAAX protease family)